MVESGNVLVRFQVDYIRHSLIHQIALHDKEISKEIEAAVDKAIENFSFADAIMEHAPRILRQEVDNRVRNFFRSPEGSAVIEKEFQEAMRRILDRRKDWVEGPLSD